MFTLTIETENAAFADDPGAEVARILREAADTVETSGDFTVYLNDINGNRVGSFTLETEGDD